MADSHQQSCLLWTWVLFSSTQVYSILLNPTHSYSALLNPTHSYSSLLISTKFKLSAIHKALLILSAPHFQSSSPSTTQKSPPKKFRITPCYWLLHSLPTGAWRYFRWEMLTWFIEGWKKNHKKKKERKKWIKNKTKKNFRQLWRRSQELLWPRPAWLIYLFIMHRYS